MIVHALREIVTELSHIGDRSSLVSEHSYTITLNNNRTEKAAIDFLLASDARFHVPSLADRKQILAFLGQAPSFARAFDLVLFSEQVEMGSEIDLKVDSDFALVELKTTRKALPALPCGFFFGATENEFELARKLGSRFKFCFVCLHPDSPGACLLTLDELEPLIRTKRTQYQINL